MAIVVLACACASVYMNRCDFIGERHHTVLHHSIEYGPKNVQITNLIKIDFHFDLFSSHPLKPSIIYTRPNVHRYLPLHEAMNKRIGQKDVCAGGS